MPDGPSAEVQVDKREIRQTGHGRDKLVGLLEAHRPTGEHVAGVFDDGFEFHRHQRLVFDHQDRQRRMIQAFNLDSGTSMVTVVPGVLSLHDTLALS